MAGEERPPLNDAEMADYAQIPQRSKDAMAAYVVGATLSDLRRMAADVGADFAALREALRHQTQRNHPYHPDGCSGCAGARAALARWDGAKGGKP